MTMAIREARVVVVLLLLAAVACTRDDSGGPGPVANGGGGGSASVAGAGGRAGDAGSAGEPSGAGGSAGSMPLGLADAGAARFRASLQGQTVSVEALDDVWIALCNRDLQLVEQLDGSWTPLRDDRPEASNLQHAAHYLDGAFHSDCRLSLGCDVSYCVPFSEVPWDSEWDQAPLIAREYVQVGSVAGPSCDALDAGVDADAGSDAGVRRVPAIESRVPTHPLGVRVRYHSDSRCQTDPITTHVAVE
jgi:hypothetical protein